MGKEDTILSGVYAVLNIVISLIIGFVLAKKGIITPATRKMLSDVNYHALLPIYALIFIMECIDRNRLTDLGYLLFSSIVSLFVSFVLTIGTTYILNFDIRIRYSFSFILVYANVVVIPQMIGDTTCQTGGKYASTPACKSQLVKAYSSSSFMYAMLAYWLTLLPLLFREKRFTLETRRVLAIILHYYPSTQEFLSDKDFTQAKAPSFNEDIAQSSQKDCHELNTQGISPVLDPLKAEIATQRSDAPIQRGLIDFMGPAFIKENCETVLDSSRYTALQETFAKFESNYWSKPENLNDRKTIENMLLKPNNLLTLPKEISVLSWEFWKKEILTSPPTLCSVIGAVLGFIFPFKEWFFDPNTKPLPIFIATVKTIGSMFSPVSVFIIGAFVAQVAKITPDLLIRWKHIIVANVLRNAIIPACGLIMIFLVIRKMNSTLFKENPLLIMIDYIYWITPNGLALIIVYMLADHFCKEFVLISVYMHLVAIPMMSVFLIIYFLIYESLT